MRARVLARQLTGPNLRRYSSALATAGVTVGVLCAVVVAISDQSAAASTRGDGLASAALRTITLDSYGWQDDPLPVTLDSVARIGERPGVESVGVYDVIQVSPISPEGTDVFDTMMFAMVPRYVDVQPALKEGREPAAADEILISSTVATETGVVLGDAIQLDYITTDAKGERTGTTMSATVVGLYDGDVSGLDPPNSVYATTELVVTLVAADRGEPEAWVRENHVFLSGHVTAERLDLVEPLVDQLIADGYGATSVSSLLAGASPTLAFIRGLAPVLVGLTLLLVVAIAWSAASSMAVSRRSEMGVLRALGWRRSEVRAAFVVQMGAMGAAAGLVAVAVLTLAGGIGLAAHAVTDATWATWMPAPSAVWLVLLPGIPLGLGVVFALGTLPVTERLARVSVDSVLRDVAS